jgi:glycosyltransferase involved in cell wall biosynthesis
VHNDLKAEIASYEAGRRPNGRFLKGPIGLFPRFDNIVSATGELNEVTRRNFGKGDELSKFCFVTNTVDLADIHRRAEVGALPERPETHLHPGTGRRKLKAAHESPLVHGLEQLGQRHGWEQVAATMHRLSLVHRYVSDDPDVTTFVTMGRLSAEKNHARLLRAFASVRERYPSVELVILGDGELRGELVSLVKERRISEWVKFAGFHANPMPLLAECDCFVMSSDYEGQGLAIIEALCLGIPVVSTSFDVVGSVLGPGQGLVVERTDDALAAGMCAFIEGRVPFQPFDATLYNAKALQEFEAVISPGPRALRTPAQSAGELVGANQAPIK